MLYGINPPENTPEYDEWLDAQEEKKELLKQAEILLEAIPCDFSNLDELEIASAMLTDARQRLDDILGTFRRLEEDFPSGHEPDPDTAYDDSIFDEEGYFQ